MYSVAGIGTDVGKTIVSAILAIALGADYWKPITCDVVGSRDPDTMGRWLDPTRHTIHPPAYSLENLLSPHHAARLENISIDMEKIILPKTKRPLVIEGVGGIFVPLTTKVLSIDLFSRWDCHWVIVSRHYLGSINHTLLTIDALKRRGLTITGLIFNGESNPDSEAAILEVSQIPLLGRLLPENEINPTTIQRYAEQWKPNLI